jgi:UDP-N-acetylglucosamine--N-acetylmuramyl-(pentapeptide) pyrophosphoryl-undecaprenol N-acetylglucosamine transferase
MRLIVSGGGTGGHIYPALAVIAALLRPSGEADAASALQAGDVLWVGSRGRIEEDLVTRAGYRFVGLAAGGLRGVGPVARIRNAAQIAAGVLRGGRILAESRPDVVMSTGGYASVSMTVAAWLRRIPVLIYLPDIEPGLAIRLQSRFARRVAVTSEASYRYFRQDKISVTGYPVRPELFALSKPEARRGLGLAADSPVLLAFGGSQGARSINQAIVNGLESLLPVCQVLHVTGRLDSESVSEAKGRLPAVWQDRYHVHAYLHNMPAALVAADLGVARAGAATLGEFPAAGLPAVLVPYPYSGQHQLPNAEFMARNGAARVLPDSELGDRLVPMILELLADESTLASMRESARALARPDAAEAIAKQVRMLAHRQMGRMEG